jgi:hypothetical protein
MVARFETARRGKSNSSWIGGDEVTGRLITNLHCWMRGVYPDWALRRGHVALIALCGQRESQFEQKPRSAG